MQMVWQIGNTSRHQLTYKTSKSRWKNAIALPAQYAETPYKLVIALGKNFLVAA
jgi:hypothetical protein